MENETPSQTILETVTSTLGSMVRDGASFLAQLRSGAEQLAEFVRRIASDLAGIAAPLAMTLGLASTAACRSDAVAADAAASEAPPKVVAAPPPPAPVAEKEPAPIGKFNITFYYVAGEEEVAARSAAKAAKLASVTSSASPANDNQGSDAVTELAAIVVPEMVTVYEGGGGCKPLAQVSKEFAAQLTLQGTGLLKDGRVINIWGHCSCERSPCFKVTPTKWGTSGTGRPLQPFRTVAVDPKVIKLGSLLYVPLLEGRTMPGRSPWGGFVHDGCVVAEDTGGGIDGNQLDLFVGRKGYYLGISGSGGSHSWARKVPVYDGSKHCERKGHQITRKAGAI
ncbi:MAG: 3D domain-containing protein [Kofleriaceae bacterium]|nr:3D domain-containing protein [Kofleriaceae bacterium]